MASAPTTDQIGEYIRSSLEAAPAYGAPTAPLQPGCIAESDADTIDFVDDSDLSNLRIVMASGAIFVIRVVREG